MKSYQLFNSYFTTNKLRSIYFEDIQNKTSVGIDRINRESFEKKLNENISIISRKVNNNTYKYSFYKQKLISKGKDKYPRIISIPTIRDKITLRTINKILIKIYFDIINKNAVHTIINNIKNELITKTYDSYIRLDIENYYPSINHAILFKILHRKIRKIEIFELIQKAVKQKTLANTKDYVIILDKGVPQGLSISNSLSNIYLIDFDKAHINNKNYKYFRFVDDILILCNEEKLIKLKTKFQSDLNKLKLTLNNEKCGNGFINNGFTYLGYKFSSKGISVRDSSVDKLKESIIKIITSYRYSKMKNLKILEWRLNLRISGCKFENKKYGWLFFFSQIDDLHLLFHLDWFVLKILKQYKININNLKVKKFTRSYKEIINNLSKTKYIIDFDKYYIDMKRELLRDVFLISNEQILTDDQIGIIFRDKIFNSVKILEEDIQQGS
jgi:RNA-directed DNA polymerase